MFETLYKACNNNDAFSDRAQKSHVLARKSLAKVVRRLFLHSIEEGVTIVKSGIIV